MSKQTFALLPKIEEVDRVMSRDSENRIYEVHPEISFQAMASASEGLLPKREREGQAERLDLIEREFPGFSIDNFGFPAKLATRNDVLDAFAALWTARRIYAGQAESLPADPPRDRRGLRMAIWF
jgi:predicted RNase H-like nuclease